MKKIFVTILMSMFLSGSALMAQTGEKVKDGAKDAAKGTERVAKKTGKAIKKGTKKVVHKGAEETRKGSATVEKKTQEKP